MPERHTIFRAEGLLFAVALSQLLLLLSFVRLLGDTNSAAFAGKIFNSIFSEPIWNTRLGLNIALFSAALGLLHAAFGAAAWGMALASQAAFPKSKNSRRQWILLWLTVLGLLVVVANAARFPHSATGSELNALVSAQWHGVTPFHILLVSVGAGILATLVTALARSGVTRRTGWLAGSGFVATLAATGWVTLPHASPDAMNGPPNIILFGIDSMRQDMVWPAQGPVLAPNIRAFLDDSVVFPDTITSLARTFPSWVSILTGRNPHTTGARVNLLPRNLIDTGETLPEVLGKEGYRTFYAIDESRFSNLDSSYGFEHTVMPPIGATDFVLGWFGDTPLSNIVANTFIGAILFPNIHANRAAATTYDPDTFVRKVSSALTFPENQPQLIAIHLTLAHWPYSWSDSPGNHRHVGIEKGEYRHAVARVDQQFSDILAQLEKKGLLRNALVIAFSDHGEALGESGDFLIPDTSELSHNHEPYERYGHGTSVLSPHQFHTVLGLRAFGSAGALIRQSGRIEAPAALEDIAPTVLDLLDIRTSRGFDGLSLAPLLLSTSNGTAEIPEQFKNRARFTETEFNPHGLAINQIATSALAEAAVVYRVDPETDRLEVRKEHLNTVLGSRQYAVLSRGHMLAAVPRADAADGYVFVYVAKGSKEAIAVSAIGDTDRIAQLRTLLEPRLPRNHLARAPGRNDHVTF